ncbi:Scarecrow-like protein 3 [Linum perenne]
MFQDDGSSSATSSPLQFFSMMPNVGSPYPWLRELKSEERGLYLIHLLLTCANHVAAGSLDNAEIALGQISQLSAPDGDTMQRIAAYFTQALADRIIKAWPGVHSALNATRLTIPSEEVLVRKYFYEMFPFLKVAFVLTNQAILDAMEGEKMVHIIDLHASEPAQWIALLQALSSRPDGPPHLRITGIHQQKEALDQMSHRLVEEAERLDIPFQFNPILSSLESLDVEKLRVKTGEALAISSALQLHHFLASEDEKRSPLSMKSSSPGGHFQRLFQDCFLSVLWSLSPKVMVVTEQDSNHNGATLMERLLEALYTYAALFDCLESNVPRTSVERLKVEKMLFGEQIKNIVACEGGERKERHEKLEKWIQRLDLAGFGNVGLSYYGMMQAKRLLQTYGCDGYRMKEDSGCVVIGWQDRPLFSVSAWRCRK